MLVARLPRSACIMKASLMGNFFLGAGARLARYIRNDSALGMVRLAVEDLKAGGQLVLFPEGTRTTTAPINPFRPGVTLIAKKAGVPIQDSVHRHEFALPRQGLALVETAAPADRLHRAAGQALRPPGRWPRPCCANSRSISPKV